MRRGTFAAVSLATLTAACGGRPPPVAATAARPAASGGAAPASANGFVTPSRALPDLVGDRGVVGSEGGQRRVLVDRMRVLARDDGSLERATELLPAGQVQSVILPSRLGGGYLFHASTNGGTQLWRAVNWLARLEPLVQIASVATEVVPGFDRLYVRLATNNKLLAIDARSGAAMPLGPLPPAAAYGALAFADGWRAVVDTDLRGPLATFDAGATWRPVGIAERPLAIFAAGGGDPLISVAGGQYVIDARGAVTYRADAPREAGAPHDEPEPSRAPGPLGRRPLRAAVEDGWPENGETAIVARGGALARVSLRDGAVKQLVADAYPEHEAACHAIRLGPDLGFVCGEPGAATVVYAFGAAGAAPAAKGAPRPLAVHAVMRFARPRFVSPSGNGALVVRGPCLDEPAEGPPPASSAAASDAAGTRAYCVRDAAGATREIRVRGDLGVERVVALADGRVAVLVPPRFGAPGQLTLLSGARATTVPIALPTEPKAVARELERGLWLEGFEEREAGVLGGWVEAGGPLVGIRVAADGRVTAGDLRSDEGGTIVSGRFGLSRGEGGRAAETSDGGMTWKVFDLPEREDDPAAPRTRACGPVGCALAGWIRVGWGKPADPDDLSTADTPRSLYLPMRAASAIPLACEATGSVTPPLPATDKPARPTPPPSPPPIFGRPRPPMMPPPRPMLPPIVTRSATPTPWAAFRNTPPPALAADEIGFDNGAPYDLISLRAYAWGRKGADWTRAGKLLVRFDDRFDPAGGVRSSAPSTPPWADETSAADALGAQGYSTTWGAYLDPSGRAALVSARRSGQCTLYAVSDGQPILPLREASGRGVPLQCPVPHGAVREGETWFFLTSWQSYDSLALWRADLGAVRQIGTFFRPAQARYSMADPPRLVRRAIGTGLGLLVASPPAPGEGSATWYVMPVDAESGRLGEPIALGRRDLGGRAPDRCAAGQDGWLIDVSLDLSPSVDFAGGRAPLDSFEWRLRLDPGSVCAEGIAARIDGVYVKESGRPAAAKGAQKPASAEREGDLPMAATERSSGRRWNFRCARR
jgi:hypothetical protein